MLAAFDDLDPFDPKKAVKGYMYATMLVLVLVLVVLRTGILRAEAYRDLCSEWSNLRALETELTVKSEASMEYEKASFGGPDW